MVSFELPDPLPPLLLLPPIPVLPLLPVPDPPPPNAEEAGSFDDGMLTVMSSL